MDELKKQIDLAPISDQVIKEKKFTLKDLWMVKDEEGDVFGPYDTKSLREYSHKYEYLFENCKIYNLKEEKWFNIFSLALFQRRKPKLVSSQNLITEHEFYILQSGLKQGPFTKEQVQNLLDKGQILPSIQISLDQGASWIKLYEHHSFDRRTKKVNDDLPFRPDAKILEKVKEKTKELESIEQDELINLAFIGNQKDSENNNTFIGKKIPQELTQDQEQKGSSFISKFFMATSIVAVIGFVVAGGSYMFQSFDQVKLESPEAATTTPSIDNSSRGLQKDAHQRRPASVESEQKSQPRRRISVRPKRYTKPKQNSVKVNTARKTDYFDNNVEKLDINDPEVQEELTRQLAGDYDLDGELVDQQEPEAYPEEEPEQMDEPYQDDNYDERDRMDEHYDDNP